MHFCITTYNAYSTIIAGLIGAFVKVTTGGTLGPIWSGVATVVVATAAFLCSLMFQRYRGILKAGSAPKNSLEQKTYLKMRAALLSPIPSSEIYNRTLTGVLDKVDGFLGDRRMASQSSMSTIFGLKNQYPLWTPQSLDRCQLIAAIYPTISIFAIWVISGHVGPAEEALHLKPNLDNWRRSLEMGVIVVQFAVLWLTRGASGWKGATILVSGTAISLALGSLMQGSVRTAAAMASISVGAVIAGVFGYKFLCQWRRQIVPGGGVKVYQSG